MEQAVAVPVPLHIAPQLRGDLLRGQQPPAGGDDPQLQQHRRQVHQAGAAQAPGGAVPDDVIEKAPVIAHVAHRPGHAGHTALDASPLKGGTGGHGAAGEAVLAPHGHLAVGAYV